MPPAGKTKSKQPKEASVPKKDEYTRIAYLYQLSQRTLSRYPLLSRGYSKCATTISKKSVLKLAPSLKRTMCKKCNTLLVPGLTMSTQLRNESKKKAPSSDILEYSCVNCGTIRRFPVGKDASYRLFSERDPDTSAPTTVTGPTSTAP